MIQPDELTGEYVKETRLAYKLNREQFYAMVGWDGKSVARLCNIEGKDSWKDGDRERVAVVLDELVSSGPPPTGPKRRAKRTKDSSTLTNDSVIVPVWCDEDDDVDESLVDVLGPDVEAANNNALLGVASWNVDGPVELPDAVPITIVNDDDEDLTSWAALEFDGVPSEFDADADERAFVVTNSLVQTVKRCKRKWWLGWYRGLAPRNENLLDVRATGNRVHKALQAWYVPDGETPVDPRDALERILTEDWTKIVTAAKARGHDEFVIADLTDKFNKAAGLERAMIEGYVQWLQETGADSELKIIASETTLKAHLYDHVRADGQVTSVYAMGLLDVRAYRITDDANLFVDHKTVGSLTAPVAMLPQNEQMIHYLLLEWLSSEDGETHCDGALYNMLRRVKRTATAKPPFYDRYEVRHNKYELESYKRRLIAETRDVLAMVEALDAGADPMDVAYPSPNKDCTWDCDFFSVCSMFDDGSRAEDALASLFVQVDPNARYEPTKGTE